MTRWLVMPRGINVGNNNRVPMAELRSALTDAGFEAVVTIGQSGNIIATRSGSEDQVIIEVQSVMADAFGVTVPMVVRQADEVREVLASNPLADVATDYSKYLAIFLSATPAMAEVVALESEDVSPEVVRLIGRTAFVWTPGGVKAMKVSHTALEKRFGGDGDRSKLEHAHEDRYQALTATQGESADYPGHDGTAGQVSRFPLSSARPTGFSGERVVHHLLRLSTTCTAVSCTSYADCDEDEAEQLK